MSVEKHWFDTFKLITKFENMGNIFMEMFLCYCIGSVLVLIVIFKVFLFFFPDPSILEHAQEVST